MPIGENAEIERDPRENYCSGSGDNGQKPYDPVGHEVGPFACHKGFIGKYPRSVSGFIRPW